MASDTPPEHINSPRTDPELELNRHLSRRRHRAVVCIANEDDLHRCKAEPILVSMNIGGRGRLPYAVVAANVSTLLALVMSASVVENSVVNVMIAHSLTSGFVTKYKMKIEIVGRRDPRMVLIALATETKDSSLYSHSPFSLSPEIGFYLESNLYPSHHALGQYLDSIPGPAMKPWNQFIRHPPAYVVFA